MAGSGWLTRVSVHLRPKAAQSQRTQAHAPQDVISLLQDVIHILQDTNPIFHGMGMLVCVCVLHTCTYVRARVCVFDDASPILQDASRLFEDAIINSLKRDFHLAKRDS